MNVGRQALLLCLEAIILCCSDSDISGSLIRATHYLETVRRRTRLEIIQERAVVHPRRYKPGREHPHATRITNAESKNGKNVAVIKCAPDDMLSPKTLDQLVVVDAPWSDDLDRNFASVKCALPHVCVPPAGDGGFPMFGNPIIEAES